jgi:hypothetical protein
MDIIFIHAISVKEKDIPLKIHVESVKIKDLLEKQSTKLLWYH